MDPRPVALIVSAHPDIGVATPVGIWLDLDRGGCREAKVVSADDAKFRAFVLTAEYRYWKQIIRKELGPIAGSWQRKVGVQGSLPIVVRIHQVGARPSSRQPTHRSDHFLDE